MNWIQSDILIENKIDLYTIFRELTTKRFVLLALYTGNTNRVFYETMVIDDERKCAIIGGEELYCFYKCIIVGWCEIDDVPKSFIKKPEPKFEGILYQNGIQFQKYDDSDTLFKDFNLLYAIQQDTNGDSIVEKYNENNGYAIWFNEIMNKSFSISYETNV